MSLLYITEEVVENFSGSGMDLLFEVLESYQENDAESEEILAQIFTELLITFEENKLDVNDIKKFFTQAIKSDDQARIFFQVLNSFAVSKNIHDLLHLLFRDNKIKIETLALHLSSDFLKSVEIVPKDYFQRTLSHKIRDEYFTQKKFNLLHEEVEGYSKFTSEMHSILDSSDAEFQLDYAIQVMEKLIGHYDLDPNRCLSLLFQVFTGTIVPHYRFILNVLKKSRWWPNVESDNSSLLSLGNGGSETAAKVIGLELVGECGTRDLPETYKCLVAILIKEGLISFGSLYKFMGPDESEMDELEAEYKKKLDRDVLVAGATALALAAPLADEEDEEGEKGESKTKNKTSQASTEKDLSSLLKLNMKFQFLKVFLGVGLYWPAIFILTKYPYLAQIDEEIPILINRLFATMIDPLYNKIRIFSDEEISSLQKPKGITFSRPHNTVFIEHSPVAHLFSFNPLMRGYGNRKYTYFYREFSTDLPKIQDIDSLIAASNELLKFNGPNLAKDTDIFIKTCEVTRYLLSQEEDKSKVFFYFKNFIFPAMPLIEENSIAIDKAFEILLFFPTEDRFSLYGELYNILAKNNPLIKIAYSKAEKSTKDVLKRLSKENVRPMMRRLAKICFSNPLPCLLTILQQIESYDNLNTLVVETARYFNAYGWDNLTAAILIRLASSRSSTYNGMSERQWVQSLASFIGKICQRYPHAIDIKTILAFILKSFYSGDTIGLLVLKEMFISMGGIQHITNLTINQIDMINCGSSLQKIVYNTIDDLRFERRATGKYLIKCMNEIDAVNELLVLLCRISNDVTFTGNESYLKVLVSKSDDVNAVIRLFVTLINLYDEDLNLMPIQQLSDLGVPWSWAYEVWRFRGKTEKDNLSLESTSSIFDNFWKLSLHDINYTNELYDNETIKLESNIKSLKDSIAINLKNKELPRTVIDKQRKDLETCEEYQKTFVDERAKHKDENEKIEEQLKQISFNWFVDLSFEEFIQKCIFPRAITSSFDAVYSARFLFKLNSMKIDNYSLVNVLDLLFKSKSLFGTLCSSTPTEAENIGLFFADILRTLQGWRDESKYGEIGLQDQDGDAITFDDFKKLLYDYHSLLLEEIRIGLQAPEYISRNNTIIFLKNLLAVYPTVDDHGAQIVNLIEKLSTTEKRNDLKLASNALLVHVKSKSKNWVPIWDFISMSEEEKEEIIKAKEEEKQRIIKEEAEAKRQKELELEKEKQMKLAKEEEEKKKLLAAASLNYDSLTAGGSGGGARTQTRTTQIGRTYEKYAIETKSEAHSRQTTPIPTQPRTLSSVPTSPSSLSKENKLQERVNKMKQAYKESRFSSDTENKVLNSESLDGHEATSNEKEAKQEESNDQEKLDSETKEKANPGQNNEETQLSTEKEDSAGDNSTNTSNLAAQKESEQKRSPLPPQNEIKKSISLEDFKGPTEPKRTPLPPQTMVARHKDDSYGRSEGRRAPLPPQHEIKKQSLGGTDSSNKVGSSRPPLGQSNANGFRNDMRTNKGNSSSNQQNSRQQPPASIPPPPPPPLPPIQHHRGRNDYGNSRGYQSNRDNYGRHSNSRNDSRPASSRTPTYDNRARNQGNRDNRNTGRNEKRNADSFGGRGYDKRPRH